MDVRKLINLASGETNFKILRLLHEKPMYAGELGEHLSASDRNVRVHLHHLRQENLVDYETTGRRHRYSIKTPFETSAHELVMTLVALADPVRKRGEGPAPAPPEEFESRTKKSHLKYLTRLLDGYIEKFVVHGTHKAGKKLGDDLQALSDRINQLMD